MNWTYTTFDGRLTVTEYLGGFEIHDNSTNADMWMGDGVDAFEGVYVDTPEFYQLLRQDMEASEEDYISMMN
jgi:hypothetical protein